jgi:alanyl aminopeptidase
MIPVCVRYGSGDLVATSCTLLERPSEEIALDGLKACPEWVIVNDAAAGYYRVNYEGDLRGRVLERAHTVLSPAERVAFLADVNALVAAGELEVAEALALVPAFLADADRHVVSEALHLFGLIERDFLPEALVPNYERAVRQLLGPRAKALGWRERKRDTDDERILRPWLVPMVAVQGKDVSLAREARALSERWIEDRTGIDPDLVSPVLGVAAAFADRPLFDRYLAEARRTTDRRDRRRILSSLGSLRDSALASDALALLLGDSFDLRDMQGVLSGIMGRRETREMAYAWVKEHYAQLFPRMRDDEQSWMMSIPASFCDAAHRKDAEEFFGPRAAKIDGGPLALAKSLEQVDLCLVAQLRNAAGVESFLRKY